MEQQYWIWLLRIPSLGAKRIERLLEYFQTPEGIYKATRKELLKVGINEKIVTDILNQAYREENEKYIAYMEKYHISLVTRQDRDYPEQLKHIYDPPIALFIKGNRKILNKTMIAMVGARNCSLYASKVARNLSYELARKSIGIISGMAKGIDTMSHIGCLQAKGETIAVLGSGVDQIYPKENSKLYQQILAQNGAIISEYLIGTPPSKMNFPARNRIISGISKGVVIVEAKKKSGSLITADFALEQGREVFVIPANIGNCYAEGSNELLKQGAKVVTKIEDILEEIH